MSNVSLDCQQRPSKPNRVAASGAIAARRLGRRPARRGRRGVAMIAIGRCVLLWLAYRVAENPAAAVQGMLDLLGAVSGRSVAAPPASTPYERSSLNSAGFARNASIMFAGGRKVGGPRASGCGFPSPVCSRKERPSDACRPRDQPRATSGRQHPTGSRFSVFRERYQAMSKLVLTLVAGGLLVGRLRRRLRGRRLFRRAKRQPAAGCGTTRSDAGARRCRHRHRQAVLQLSAASRARPARP